MDEEENIISIDDYSINLEERIKNHGLINDYLAINNKDNKKYICKKVLKEKKKKNELENSIIVHSKINHENIVKFYDFYQDDNYYYILLEYIEGTTLSKIIQDISYDENEIFIIVEQILNALLYLYDSNIIIKDLSLRNIFIREKNVGSDKTKIILCNLDNKGLLSNLSNFPIEEYYNKIVFKLGIIICKLIDKEIFSFLRKNKMDKNEENEKLLSKWINNKIFNKDGISGDIKELLNKMLSVEIGKRIHIKKIKEKKWFRFKKNNESNENDKNYENSKHNDNTKEKNKESASNESFSSNGSEIKENIKNKKLKVVEETIITDEGYLELYKKEKELLLGLINHYDKEQIIKSIKKAKDYSEYVKPINNSISNYSQSETTERTNDKSEKTLSRIERKKRYIEKNKENRNFWNIFICK